MSEQGLLLDVDPYARHEDDFYRTPAWMVHALLRRIWWLPHWHLVEPCVGDGAIVRALPPQFRRITTNDIVERPPFTPDFQMDAKRADSWVAFENHGGGYVDVTLTNPTFVDTFEIAQHAVARSRIGVILLQRCTWVEPTDDRDEWLAAHPPYAQIVLPRWNFRSLDGRGGSDSAPPSWFLWNGPLGLGGQTLCAPGIHVVTKRERDELIQEGRP